MARHKDKGAYQVGNVEIITSDANNAARKTNGRLAPSWITARKGEAHGKAILTEQTVIKIFYAKGTQYNIASKFKISRPQVSLIRTRRAWKHITAALPKRVVQ